ncbi:hypothetical protein Micbo1qcDRAFT_207064 [Microdochium bolleyi]|uniref:Uncharacterized protein n=1 Tax=Microdochium bolleyi TaxID=196109 RepID=A0A136IVY1_9PEZI|nr:hypothetical protein Micbo1qcDRAFT_207064 [Microdochium bolleyi]
MAPVQNTFSIIPNFASVNNPDDDGSRTRASRPAMTTKQAKKAYQQANRGPKLTKAEIRRQELFEQDRIRKEAEKERNQARARVARDRKKEKEDNERAAKKKKGLPLVNVRPSQDTIARFVRFSSPIARPRASPASESVTRTVFTSGIAPEIAEALAPKIAGTTSSSISAQVGTSPATAFPCHVACISPFVQQWPLSQH